MVNAVYNYRKKSIYYYNVLLVTFACVMTWSCGNDIPEPDKPSTEVNANANNNSIAEASRLEIPRLKNGDENLFIVKRALLRDKANETFVNFCIEYDQTKYASRWTAFRWDINNTYDSNCGRAGDYSADPDVPTEYRLSGYFNGYQRGHMLASEDRQCSASANRQTFYMTNMHPQYGRFNGYDKNGSYVWVNTEQLVRKLYSNWTKAYNSQDTIYAVKGGTIDDRANILGYTSCGSKNNIIVPKYYYMALLYKSSRSQTHGYKAIALWIEHKEGNTTSGKSIAQKYAISIDKLEEKTGIDFFCNLPDYIEKDVESKFNLAAWGWNP